MVLHLGIVFYLGMSSENVAKHSLQNKTRILNVTDRFLLKNPDLPLNLCKKLKNKNPTSYAFKHQKTLMFEEAFQLLNTNVQTLFSCCFVMHEIRSLFTMQTASLYYRLGWLNIKDKFLSTQNMFTIFYFGGNDQIRLHI